MTNFAVVYREYERGWGSKDFHATFHETWVEANRKVEEEHAKHTATVVPDYYITARVEVVTPENKAWLEKLAI